MNNSKQILTLAFLVVVFAIVLPIAIANEIVKEQQVLIVVPDTVEVCVEHEPTERDEFYYLLRVNEADHKAGVTGLVFTTCAQLGAEIDPKFLRNAFDLAKEAVYQKDEKHELTTVEDVRLTAENTLNAFVNSHSQYAGRFEFKVKPVSFKLRSVQ